MKTEIIKFLEAFMQNSFLIPSRHSGWLEFTNLDEQYQTYANDEGSYLTIEIKQKGKIIFNITASKHSDKWSIQGQNLLESKTVKTQLKNHHKYLNMIYDEMHSINPDKNKLKEIRKKITKEQKDIRDIERGIKRLKLELEDFKKIK